MYCYIYSLLRNLKISRVNGLTIWAGLLRLNLGVLSGYQIKSSQTVVRQQS